MRIRKRVSVLVITILSIALILVPQSAAFAYDDTGTYFRSNDSGYIYAEFPEGWEYEEVESDDSPDELEHIITAHDSENTLKCDLYYQYDETDRYDKDWSMYSFTDEEECSDYFYFYGLDALVGILDHEGIYYNNENAKEEVVTTDSYLSFMRSEYQCKDEDFKPIYVIAYTRGAGNLAHQIILFRSSDPFTEDQLSSIKSIADSYSTDDAYAMSKLSYKPDFDISENTVILSVSIILAIIFIIRRILRRRSKEAVKARKPQNKLRINPDISMSGTGKKEKHLHHSSSQVSMPASADSHYVESLTTLVNSGLLTRNQRSEMLKKYYDSLE